MSGYEWKIREFSSSVLKAGCPSWSPVDAEVGSNASEEWTFYQDESKGQRAEASFSHVLYKVWPRLKACVQLL